MEQKVLCLRLDQSSADSLSSRNNRVCYARTQTNFKRWYVKEETGKEIFRGTLAASAPLLNIEVVQRNLHHYRAAAYNIIKLMNRMQ